MQVKLLNEKPTVHVTANVIGSQLGDWTEIGPDCDIRESEIGDYSYTSRGAQIIYAEIGKFCSIAALARINPGNHPLQRAALHHFTYRSRQFFMGEEDDSFFDWRRSFPVTLGHDVWIGHGAVILPGVKIGTGAAVGAGAVVSRDVPPFTIVAGVPAKPIRERFPRDVRDKLLEIAWWDWPHDRLKAALGDFRYLDAPGFVEKYHHGGAGGKGRHENP